MSGVGSSVGDATLWIRNRDREAENRVDKFRHIDAQAAR
jgi:hypothetical protein